MKAYSLFLLFKWSAVGWFCSLFLVSFPLMARGHFLCPERQRKQNALLFATVRKCKELSSQFLTLSFFTTLSAHLCGKLKSVLIDNFCVSPLCFSGSVLPHLFLKDSSYKTSPLVSAFTKLGQSSFTLHCHYSLPSHYPTFVGRWQALFFGLVGVSLMLTSRLI